MPDRVLFSAEADFQSARSLGDAPDGCRSRRLHGHGFVARVRAALPPGWAAFPGAEPGQLQARLRQCVEPLDYRLLNDCLDAPSDENLAAWIAAQLAAPGVEQVDLASRADQGVVLDRSGQAHVWRAYRFEAAHRLPHVPAQHKCGRMHGHGYRVVLHARLAPGEAGMRAAAALDQAWRPIHARLDHACLNELAGLENPTSERIAGALWDWLEPSLRGLSWVTVHETDACGAHFDGRRYRIWTQMSLDSSVRLKRAPPGEAGARLHGHTYTLRLHLNAPLHQVLGWVVDFGDVKELFRPVFLRLDHQPLHELAGLEDADALSLAHWIRRAVGSELPQLDRLDLYATPGCGAILAWGGDEPALPV